MNHSFHHHSSPFDHHQSLSSHVHPTSWICQGPSHQLVDLGRCLGMVWSESPAAAAWRQEDRYLCHARRPGTAGNQMAGKEVNMWVWSYLPSQVGPKNLIRGFSGDSTATAISLHQLVVVSYISTIYIYACDYVCVHHPLKEHLSYTHAYIHIIYMCVYNIMYINKYIYIYYVYNNKQWNYIWSL